MFHFQLLLSITYLLLSWVEDRHFVGDLNVFLIVNHAISSPLSQNVVNHMFEYVPQSQIGFKM